MYCNILIFQLENDSIDLSSKIEEISSLNEMIIELKQQHNVQLENCQQQQELLQQKYESLQVSGKMYCVAFSILNCGNTASLEKFLQSTRPGTHLRCLHKCDPCDLNRKNPSFYKILASFRFLALSNFTKTSIFE